MFSLTTNLRDVAEVTLKVINVQRSILLSAPYAVTFSDSILFILAPNESLDSFYSLWFSRVTLKQGFVADYQARRSDFSDYAQRR